jgi:hypothetical protein
MLYCTTIEESLNTVHENALNKRYVRYWKIKPSVEIKMILEYRFNLGRRTTHRVNERRQKWNDGYIDNFATYNVTHCCLTRKEIDL